MKIKQTLLITNTAAIILSAALTFTSCTSTPKEIPEDLTAKELIQNAQNAYDSGKTKTALNYYNEVTQRFYSDVNYYIQAKYETAHIYVKKHKYALALPIFDELNTLYKNSMPGTLPGDYQKLIELDYAKIPEKAKTAD